MARLGNQHTMIADVLQHQWECATDLLVVGYGFAGAATAIAAADLGLEPMIIEKMPNPGGLSITSGGGIGIATEAQGAFACLRAACGGRTPDDVLLAFAEELTQVGDWIADLAASSDYPLQLEAVTGDAGYDLPGRDAFGWILVKPIEGFTGFPWASGLRGGARLFKVLMDNVAKRDIPVHCDTTAERLLVGPDGAVVGARVRSRGDVLDIAARHAVVLACGGFEWDESMKQHYFQAQPVLPVAGRGNTGDGIRMAQAVGADLWHMWHFHGSYGFRPPGFDRAIRHHYAGNRTEGSRMPWIVVDRDGRRYMNEIHPSPNDTNARPMDTFDPDRLEYPRIPSYAVFDDEGRKLGPIGFPIRTSDADHDYRWSSDNLAEVRAGWIHQADTLDELGERLAADGHAHMKAGALAHTVARWNAAVDARSDPEFLRPPTTMMRILTAPFYAVPVWPLVSNTQGGPVHNAQRQVLDPFGSPIPRLYTAGELGSVFGHLYLLAGNIGECFTSGRQAARHAASLPSWDNAIGPAAGAAPSPSRREAAL